MHVTVKFTEFSWYTSVNWSFFECHFSQIENIPTAVSARMCIECADRVWREEQRQIYAGNADKCGLRPYACSRWSLCITHGKCIGNSIAVFRALTAETCWRTPIVFSRISLPFEYCVYGKKGIIFLLRIYSLTHLEHTINVTSFFGNCSGTHAGTIEYFIKYLNCDKRENIIQLAKSKNLVIVANRIRDLLNIVRA